MKVNGRVLLVTLCLASLALPALGAPGAAPADCPALAVPSPAAASLAEALDPAPEMDLFLPEPQLKSCFTDCVNDWVAIYCAGLSGPELQQCVNAGAEGCRCSCGGYCP